MPDRLHPEILPLRHASREMIRELGFLQSAYVPADVAHSEAHALIEIDDRPGITLKALAERLRLDKSTTSRVVRALSRKGLVRAELDARDQRRSQLQLSGAGAKKLAEIHRTANREVQRALELLSTAERGRVLEGVRLYAQVLGRARARARYTLRPARRGDDLGIARLIRGVMPEVGASGPGFAIHDLEVDCMFETYQKPRSAYFVVVDGAKVVGGGGIAPLSGVEAGTCELRKMYFFPELRGLGFGQELMTACLAKARELGFRTCYLETLKSMAAARALYEKSGFRPRKKPLGKTGHFGCDVWYSRPLHAPGKGGVAAQGR